jgi:hypothetical protein
MSLTLPESGGRGHRQRLVFQAQMRKAQSVHTSKRQLKEFLLNYIAHHNENPKQFVWTKGPEKLQRIIEATKQYQAAHPCKPGRRRARNTVKN